MFWSKVAWEWERKREVGVEVGIGSGARARSDILKISQVGSDFGGEFYIIYISIYFDAYMSIKSCRIMNL